MNFKLPTETIELPSKGLLYPKSSPLSSGVVEMCYMGAYHEDILTNSNFIKNGTVIDKLLQALIVTPGVNYDDILIGDKDAIMIAARILGYGKSYPIKLGNSDTYNVDLSLLEEKPIHEEISKSSGTNEFSFELPQSKEIVTFKLLTHGDEIKINKEIEGLKKIKPDKNFSSTTRLKFMITSVAGSREQKDIREFVDKYMIASDARALRQYYSEINPGVNLVIDINTENYVKEGVEIPITLGFFWPDSGI